MPTRTIRLLAVSAMVTLLLSLAFISGLFQDYERHASDALLEQKPIITSIVIISIDDKSINQIGRWPWPRQEFITLFEVINQSAAIGLDVGFYEPYNDSIDAQLSEVMRSQGKTVLPSQFTYDTIPPQLLAPTAPYHTLPSGIVNIYSETDGVVREAPLILGGNKSFALKIAEAVVGKVSYPNATIRIHFHGPPGSFQTLPFVDALDTDPAQFKDKIVLVGATTPSLHDNYITPTSNGKPMSGVEIHAHILNTILQQDYLVEQNPLAVIILIALFSLSFTIMVTRLRVRYVTLIVILCIIFYYVAAFLLIKKNVILNLLYPPLAILTSTAVTFSYSYVNERKEKSQVTAAFSQYVSPEIITEILKDLSKLKLGGERRDITILFSDVRGFTSFSEKMQPEELVTFLNEYLTLMSNIIIDHRGVIDKYIGDAIMAFWGAPLENKKQEDGACLSAVLMIRRLQDLNSSLKARNLPPIEIGIGINSGPAVVGNMGSQRRFDYTAMGDTVNLASRLESLTKQYGVPIIISESTFLKVQHDYQCRLIDQVKVKGKQESVRIYELVEEKDKIGKENKQFLATFAEGFAFYQNGKWSKAMDKFNTCLKLKEDKTSRLLIERCQEQSKSRPKKWDGVYEWKTK